MAGASGATKSLARQIDDLLFVETTIPKKFCANRVFGETKGIWSEVLCNLS